MISDEKKEKNQSGDNKLTNAKFSELNYHKNCMVDTRENYYRDLVIEWIKLSILETYL